MWTINIAWQNRNHQFPHIGYCQEMLKHQTDTVLFWAVVTFLPDVYDVSESTFFYGKICNTLWGSKLLVCNAGLLDIQ